ncbi:hypothetical protein [Flavobacterium sp. 316]|uniref:hypothetical protein n=1 Tax=Flavobacterium sp. 316 TaxID=1603293 RepID=UPI00126A6CD6|nr:hypothetical protein [Flavobacterium sp. 316]
MKVLKSILGYLLWIILSLLLGIAYMRLLLGEIPKEDSYSGLGFFLNLFYHYGLVYVGLTIGSIIAFFFILTDFIFLRKKLSFDVTSLLIRISIFLLISIIVFILHYFLEKIIDVI